MLKESKTKLNKLHISEILGKYLFLFAIGGALYYNIEILYRDFSHWTMFVLGGICFLFCGLQNEITSWECPLILQIFICNIFVVVSEFITGCIVNIWLGWNVWDYSLLPFNILGQSCLYYALLFMPLCLLGIIFDDWIRYLIFGEEKPHYSIFFPKKRKRR